MAEDTLSRALRPGPVAVLGDVFVDLLFADLDAEPAAGREVYAGRWALEPGGLAITAIALARLGRTARLAAVIGTDSLADAIVARIAAEGVDTTTMRRAPEGTSLSAAVVYPHDRGFITRLGERSPDAVRAAADAALASDISHLHLSARHPLADSVLAEAHARGLSVSLAVGWQPDFLRSDTLRRRMAEATLVAVNADEALEASGERDIERAVDVLAQRVPWLLATLGAEGAILAGGGRRWRVPAAPARVADTTGAGDVYIAALLDGAMHGLSEEEALTRAAYVAARAVERLGGTAGVPRPGEDPALRTLDPREAS